MVEKLERNLRFSIPARADALAGMRAYLDRWLAELELPSETRAELVAAAHEAGANAVEHAYRDGSVGDVDRRRRRRRDHAPGDRSRIVAIRGRRSNRGRGMHIMRSLVDGIEVVRRDDGTTVILAVRSGRRALCVTRSPAGSAIEADMDAHDRRGSDLDDRTAGSRSTSRSRRAAPRAVPPPDQGIHDRAAIGHLAHDAAAFGPDLRWP